MPQFHVAIGNESIGKEIPEQYDDDRAGQSGIVGDLIKREMQSVDGKV